MFLERVNSKGMSGNKYWYNSQFNKGAGTVNALPNCTTFCLGECLESVFATSGRSYFRSPYQRPGAFPNAAQWYSLWDGEKGIEPKVGGVCVWDGGNGHVAFVLETKDVGSKGAWIKVCQSNYKGEYFEVKEYTVKVNQITPGVGLRYVGCCYNDIYDIRTTRNKLLPQVEVLTDSLNCREKPNGAVYSGRRVPKGIYTIRDRKSEGGYVWACAEDGFWFALNDADGWTKTYEVEKVSYETLLNAYDILSQKYTDLVLRYEKDTGKKV